MERRWQGRWLKKGAEKPGTAPVNKNSGGKTGKQKEGLWLAGNANPQQFLLCSIQPFSKGFHDYYKKEVVATIKRSKLAILGSVLILSSILAGMAIPAFSAEPVAAEIQQDLTAEITKRTEWTDETNGDGQVTLQYSSNSGSTAEEKSLNLILIQDKSGSMDSNYAYNLEAYRSNWVDEGSGSNKLAEIYYPIQNPYGWTENISDFEFEESYETRVKSAICYRDHLNSETGAVIETYPYVQGLEQYLPQNGHQFRAFDSTITVDGYNGDLINGEGYYNAPCNVEGHYYLLVQEIDLANGYSLPAYSMVEGQLLNSVWDTDKHEYQLLSDHQAALDELSKGRRVIRIDAGTNNAFYPASYWNSEDQILQSSTAETDLYFLDISSLTLHSPTQRTNAANESSLLPENQGNGSDYLYTIDGWFLETTPGETCHQQDRLSLSQQFATDIVTKIKDRNLNDDGTSNNKVAYIPFWGDVPTNGTWENGWVADYSGSEPGSSDDVISDGYDVELGEVADPHFDEYPGVTQIGFPQGDMSGADFDAIQNQIANDFTYDGTNWTNAFQAASDILDARSAEDQQKETLVIFLTDGNPAGTQGGTNDALNAYINGNVIDGYTVDGQPIGYSALMEHEGVTVISVGVGVAIGDADLVTRLGQINTTIDEETGDPEGAIIARTNEELANLTDTVMNRINETIYGEITGFYAFYADRLSVPFALDEDKINMDDWTILQSASPNIVQGVPSNVYYAATRQRKNVYVRSTKTVYWYIGDMTDGDFNAEGHELVFSVTYSDYNVSTGGADKSIASNTLQQLTYVTSQDTGTVQTVTTDTPSIIFNRSDEPTLTVEKTIATSYDTDQTYRYVYSTHRQESGQVTDYQGVINVTIPAGSKEGSAAVTGVEPGTYYVYEVDQNDTIISTQISTVTLSRNAEITTAAFSETVPHSATASDDTQLANRNNVLTIISTNGLASFVDNTTFVNVEKTWDDNDYENRPESITVSLLRNGAKVNEMVLAQQNNWQGTFENLPAADTQGNEYEYTVTEEEIIGYQSQITETQDNHFVIENTLLKSTIHINKYDTDGKTPLAGVTFEIRDSDGNLVDSKTTGSNGRIDFTELMPDTYVLTETSTVNGMSLLPEPITVTMPMVMSEQEVIDNKVDTSKCVYYNEAGTYLVCEITYSVTNSANLDMPASGGDFNPWIWFSLMGGLLTLGAATVLLLQRKKTHR